MNTERVLLTGCRHVWKLPVEPARLYRAVNSMLEAAGNRTGRVELCLLRDAGMSALNLCHLGCTGPTNVLAFPEDAPAVLGSLALCVDAIRREALLYGQDEGEHCLRLLAHGLAHLLGHNHGLEMDRLCKEMLRACSC